MDSFFFLVKADKKAEEEKRQREEDERLYREEEMRELAARSDSFKNTPLLAILNRSCLFSCYNCIPMNSKAKQPTTKQKGLSRYLHFNF